MTKESSAVDLDVPPAAPSETTLKEWSAVDLDEATLKERSAADRRVPPAAPLDATIRDPSLIDRHVPLAASFEATLKDRSMVELDVPPPVSPASEWPTSRPSGWLTWWLTWRPDDSSTPAELPMAPPANAQRAPTGTPMLPVDAQPVAASSARARTWIVVTALIVATLGGTVALIYGATNDSATNATNLDAVRRDP